LGKFLFFFNNTKFSNSSSDRLVRWLLIVNPAQLNSRSAAALAGSGVFSLMNSAFSAGQAAADVDASASVAASASVVSILV